MIMVSISLVMSVIVTNIYLRKDTPTRVPRCLRQLFLRGDVAKSVARSVPPPPPPPPPTSNGKLRQTTASRDGDVWTVGGQVCDDIELTVHRPRRRVVDSIHLSDKEDDVDVLDRRLAPLSRDLALVPDGPHRHAHRLDRAVCGSHCAAGRDDTTEWQELARIIDRLFFWLFMVSSVGLLTGLYVSVTEHSTSTDDTAAP